MAISRKAAPLGREQLVSRGAVENLIAEGRHVIIVDGKVLKVDAWLRFHPGGEKSIKHMVGRDATDEINGFHSPETKQRMFSFQIGRIEGRWVNFIPPIQGGKFRTTAQQIHGEEQEVESETSSANSPEHSPIFDPVDVPADSLRQRKTGLQRASSSSSVSSVELDMPTKANSKPKQSLLDARTQKELVQDQARYPALDPEVQDGIVQKYRQLKKRIEDEDLYQCHYSAYAIEFARYGLLFAGFVLCLQRGWYIPSALFLGFFWHQIAFFAHDAGHMGITHDFHTDTCVGIIIADYLGGLSLGWWKRSHNVHHIVTNSTEHDPDIQHMPFFAISHRFFDSIYSTYHDKILTYDAAARVMMRFQHHLYYPILCFGRFNLYVQSWIYLLGGQAPRKGPAWWHRWFEIVGMAVFWTWFGYGVVYKSIDGSWNKFLFVLISHAVTMPLHVQITLSHFAMSTSDFGPKESFPQRMLRTTMDVDCPQWLDFIHGGLQFQAIHHLYPRIPRHNLRRTQKLVQQFCDEVDIPYALYGFIEGNKSVISRLEDVSRQAAIFAACQRTVAEGGWSAVFEDH